VLVINETYTYYSTTHFSAGDVIKLFTQVTTTGTTVKVTDVTKTITEKLTGPGASASNAYAGDSDWLDSSEFELPVPSFGTLTFTHCHIDGTPLAGWNPTAYQRVNSSGVLEIATGALSSTGTAFPTKFKHS
jgi:hypothetical protein